MNLDIDSAAPMVNELGTRDLSGRTVTQPVLQFPQHLPKFYIFGETGPMGPQYVDLARTTLTELYGDKTFDVKSKYFTHQTPYVQAAARAGNNCVVHRLPGRNAKDKANVGFYLDILPTIVTLYAKNADGSLQYDDQNNPKPLLDNNDQPVTMTGYKVCYVLDHVSVPLGEYQPGLLTQRAGIQVDGQTQSTQYPLFEMSAAYAGEFAKSLGSRMYAALKTDIVPFPDNFLADAKMYPYYFQLMKLSPSVAGKIDPVLNGFGAQYSRFVLQEEGRDPGSDAVVDLTTVLQDQYIDPASGAKTGLGNVKMYADNIALVSKMLYEAEMVVVDQHRDSEINNAEQNYFALNILGFTSSNGSPYQAIKVVDVVSSIRMTKNSAHFMDGASDGEIDEDLLDQLFIDDMENYQNTLTEYHDLVKHPESIIYDSGFGLAAKRAAAKFISKRKDTFIVLSTFAHNAPAGTLADQTSVGIALKTMVELYSESAYFGTKTMRGLVMGGSGDLTNSLYKKRVSTAYEVLCMAADYMGAANGAWKNGKCFDKAPNNILKYLKNLDVVWVPASVRKVLWGVGVNFALRYSTAGGPGNGGQNFFPALQTVYDDDTSVLNNFFNAVGVCYLNKVAHAAWREFSGDIEFSAAQLEERVNTFVSEQVKDKFDGKLVVVPAATVTSFDANRGYSWTLPIKLYGRTARTVLSTYVEAHRLDELDA